MREYLQQQALGIHENFQMSERKGYHLPDAEAIRNCSKRPLFAQGMENAVPKVILRMMNVEGMTRENVASHLQKYRLHLKHQANGQGPKSISMQAAEGSFPSGQPSTGISTAKGLPTPQPGSVGTGLQPVAGDTSSLDLLAKGRQSSCAILCHSYLWTYRCDESHGSVVLEAREDHLL